MSFIIEQMSINDVLNLNLPDKQYVSYPLIARAEALMIWAPSGVGKSLFAMHWAAHIACGAPFGPWRNTLSKILYLDAEMSIFELEERISGLKQNSRVSLDQVNRNLYISSMQMRSDGIDLFSVVDEQHVSKLIDHCHQNKLDLVIIDNLSMCSVGLENENDSQAVSAINRSLQRIKKAGIAVILIHHSTKTGGNYRGSSGLEATFESILSLERCKEGSSDSILRLKTRVCKGRNKSVKVGEERSWSLSEEGHFVDENTRDEENLEKILSLAKTRKFSTQKALAKHLEISPATLSRRRQDMITDGVTTEEEWASCFN